MSDKIKSSITTSYMLFIFDFADPSSVDKSNIEKQIECPVMEVFDSQKKTDSAKTLLGKEGFNKMLSVYFSNYQTQDGFDFSRLANEIKKNKKVFLRHLGKEKLLYLTLLISIMDALSEPRKGLLYDMEAS